VILRAWGCAVAAAVVWCSPEGLRDIGSPKGLRYVQQQPPQTDRPVFRSSVQTIEVDVRVFDKDGRFVPDLTRDDFQVFEDGVEVPLQTLFIVESALKPGLKSRPTTTDAGPNSSTDVGPNFSSGKPTPIVAARQTWVFIFDLNHLTPGRSFDSARAAVRDFIGTRLAEGDLAGIVAGDRLVNNRLTSVRQELLEGLETVKPRNDARSRFLHMAREWPRFQDEEEAIRVAKNEPEATARAIARAKSDDPDAAADPEGIVRSKAVAIQQDSHRATTQTLAALNALASGLAAIPGPKTVVFVSEGFVVQDVETMLRSVADRTARAGGRVYAIDVRGLGRGINSGLLEQTQADDMYTASQRFDALADATNSLAADTGGLLIRNENNFGRAMTRIADDAEKCYVVTYQAPNSTYDGKFRRIEVRVKRPGLKVRARRGYLAIDPAKMPAAHPAK
jgi:VWFA-related protein